MKLVMFQMLDCPFCKHFKRIFYRDVPDGEEVILDGHGDQGWIDHRLDFVPTVIAYDDDGKEISRLSSVKLVGIRKGKLAGWLRELGLD